MRVYTVSMKMRAFELRKTGSDYYIKIQKKYLKFIEGYNNHDTISFIDKKNLVDIYTFKVIDSGEKGTDWRLSYNKNLAPSFKEYINKYNIEPGDEITIERCIDNNGNDKFFIDVKNFNNRILLSFTKKNKSYTTDMYSEDKLKSLLDKYDYIVKLRNNDGILVDERVVPLNRVKNREDSKHERNCYTLNNKNLGIDIYIQENKNHGYLEVFNSCQYIYSIFEIIN